ncbi:hypothetical protein A4X03_0g7860 [Tilletia caries]|uniref:Uncharacterized protein n=1 Tax=Tilletia caries TaxID=13290 RepID=A0A8T8SLR6_9BASI|nr:hypothetical protein A4X03_0g7860 [Tilletia caries]
MKLTLIFAATLLTFDAAHRHGILRRRSLRLRYQTISTERTGYDKALEQRQQLHVGLLNKIAQDIWADADPTFKQISVCHFPQLGYLLNILVMEDASEELPT